MEDTTCPTCGKELNTVRGKRQHHTKVHHKPLPNRTCADCGDMFYDEKAQLKFCEDCKLRKGEKAPNYKNAKETTSCDNCGSEFEYYPSDKKGIYCSDCQENAIIENNLTGDEFSSGEENPNWNGGKKEACCDYCGDEFSRRKKRLKDSIRNFCSPKCNIKWMRDSDVDIKQLFNRDETQETTDEWMKVRRIVLERDDYSCQVCDNERSSHNNIHHLIPRHLFNKDTEAHYEKNCITLCSSCHTSVENGMEIIPYEVLDNKGLEEPEYKEYTKNN